MDEERKKIEELIIENSNNLPLVTNYVEISSKLNDVSGKSFDIDLYKSERCYFDFFYKHNIRIV